eukprot:scaffold413_cov134-Isochrysis_galbana.AAC.9
MEHACSSAEASHVYPRPYYRSACTCHLCWQGIWLALGARCRFCHKPTSGCAGDTCSYRGRWCCGTPDHAPPWGGIEGPPL